VIASARVPTSGTQANFMARLQLHLTNRFAFTYWHWSNGHISDSNPGMDAVGVSVRLRGPHGVATGKTGITTAR
jgi:Lipid A 3-O-deacylase (PagL)